MTSKRIKSAFLRGVYEIDVEGGMITLPEAFRIQLPTEGDEGKAWLCFSPNGFGGYRVTRLLDPADAAESSCAFVRMDGQGRIVLPKDLRAELEIEQARVVVLVGMLHDFEAWSPGRLERLARAEEEESALSLSTKEELRMGCD